MSTASFPPSTYAADDGAPDPAVSEALGDYAADSTLWARAVVALSASRLLVPIVAEEVDADHNPRRISPGVPHPRAEGTTEMALPLLEGQDGRRAVPAFTSQEALARWNPAARPVPVSAVQAADFARSGADGAALLVVDVAGPVTYVLDGPELEALAEGRLDAAMYDDETVRLRVSEILAADPRVEGAYLRPAHGADAQLLLVLQDGPDAATAVQAAAQAVGAADEVRASVVRGLEVAATLAPDRTTVDPRFRLR